jgi:hypothetical protein
VHILPLSQGVPLSGTFIGLYLGDEATQTTRTSFSECTLNPPTIPRSLSVEFEYTLRMMLWYKHNCQVYFKLRKVATFILITPVFYSIDRGFRSRPKR